MISTPTFKTWRTITLGTGLKTAEDFRKALRKANYSVIDKRGDDILGKPGFTVSLEKIDVELVRVSGVDLGFNDKVLCRGVYARAKELGLDLCLAEVGPQLRLQYKNQPLRESLYVAMKPIVGSRGSLRIFSVEHRGAGSLYMDGVYGSPDRVHPAHRLWVFQRPL